MVYKIFNNFKIQSYILIGFWGHIKVFLQNLFQFEISPRGDGVSPARGNEGYRLAINVKLKGSVIADQILDCKAMVATVSSKPFGL